MGVERSDGRGWVGDGVALVRGQGWGRFGRTEGRGGVRWEVRSDGVGWEGREMG